MTIDIRISERTVSEARRLRASGLSLPKIAVALGVSVSWVGRRCSGIGKNGRPLLNDEEKATQISTIRMMVGAGAVDRDIAHKLGLSVTEARYLRQKHFGHKPGFLVKDEDIKNRVSAGKTTREIADELRISIQMVRNVARRIGLGLVAHRIGSAGVRDLMPLLPMLVEQYNYNALTGEFTKYGKAIGSKRTGYHEITVQGRRILAHRLAWVLYYKEEPPRVIDHQDGDPLNNKIDNLRRADWNENAFNRSVSRRSKTGIKGIYQKKDGGFRCSVTAFGVVRVFERKNLEDARKTRQILAEQMHGEFVRHG